MNKADVWTITSAGNRFFPFRPNVAAIDIDDIALSLSGIYRFGGRSQISVAQHCVMCCDYASHKGFPARVNLALLLHDAHEAYLGDISRPVRSAFPEIATHDKSLMLKVLRWADIHADRELLDVIETIDDLMLNNEMAAFFPANAAWHIKPVVTPTHFRLIGWGREETRLAYLSKFTQWKAEYKHELSGL